MPGRDVDRLSSEQLSAIELNDYLDRNVIDRFSILPGVASITIGGEKNMQLEFGLIPIKCHQGK